MRDIMKEKHPFHQLKELEDALNKQAETGQLFKVWNDQTKEWIYTDDRKHLIRKEK